MKFKFKYEKGSADRFFVFIIAAYLAAAITTFILVCCMPSKKDYIVALLLLFALICMLVSIFKKMSPDGYILCLSKQNCIAVCHGRRQRIIPIEDIESVSCLPEITYGTYSVNHMLVLTVILKTGKKLEFYAKMDIDKDMPVQQPEKFKEYIAEQPMMKLYEYINKCLGAK